MDRTDRGRGTTTIIANMSGVEGGVPDVVVVAENNRRIVRVRVRVRIRVRVRAARYRQQHAEIDKPADVSR